MNKGLCEDWEDMIAAKELLSALPIGAVLLDETFCVCYFNAHAKPFLAHKNPERLSLLTLMKNDALHESLKQAHSAPFLLEKGGEQWLLSIKKIKQYTLLTVQNHTRIHHLEQLRSEFIGNVSHELRTPLTVLMGYLENFAQGNIPIKWQRGILRMQEQTERMNSLVNDLLMLSRLESEEIPTACLVDMPRLLMQVCDEVQASNPKLHLVDLHLDTAKKVMGIPLYLHSAVFNLVLNAIKYTPQNGEIGITWEEVSDGALLSVSDNGIGIAKEHLARLTERFYRVDSGRSRATGGTGLGLSIVKHVLNHHDAKLCIDSTEHEGSTFQVFFPKHRCV